MPKFYASDFYTYANPDSFGAGKRQEFNS